MPKRTKKLLVYFGKNFLSEISKADVNDKVKPEFKELYDVIKKGFKEEKLLKYFKGLAPRNDGPATKRFENASGAPH